MFGKKSESIDATTIPFNQMNGLLDRGCSFRGKLTFDGSVQINGDFEGEIFSDGTLIVGPEARVNAKISVSTLVVYGQVQGEIDAKSKIEMHTPAKVRANLSTPRLSMEEGVLFLGQCHMEPEQVNQPLSQLALNPDNTEEAEDVLVM